MFKVYTLENQNFYLNDSLISGLQSLSISNNNNINGSFSVNDASKNYYISGPIVSNIELEYVLSSYDRFITYTGDNYFSGMIQYGDNFFSFSSGFLTNYSINYKLNEYPKANISLVVFGELSNTSGINSNQAKNPNEFIVSDNCYIDLDLEEAEKNRLESFSININVQRQPNYTVNSYLPEYVLIKYPIIIDTNFGFSISEYVPEKVTKVFNNLSERDLNISFREYNKNESLLTFNIKDLINAESQMNYSLTDDAKLNLKYTTYIVQ